MPDLPGTELSLEISKIDPDLPIILCTGYRNRLTEEEARHYGISSLCAKPLLVNEVSAIIRSTLARQPA
jgi:DNA-binding NtrC family response regulator